MVAITNCLALLTFTTAALGVKNPIFLPSKGFVIWYGRPGETRAMHNDRTARIREACKSEEWKLKAGYNPIHYYGKEWGYVGALPFGANFTFAEKFLNERGYEQNDNWKSDMFSHITVFTPAWKYSVAIDMLEKAKTKQLNS
ncbi:hypothetical protein PspLS_03488 [Pyricularia sp. CBS 133598]|nr:hypothetical protein PspLS_03488 [Pyricularia sp. CBS 133598]